MKKSLFVTLLMIMILSLVSACVGTPTETATEEIDSTEPEESSEETEPAESTEESVETEEPEPVTLRFIEKNPENASFWDTYIPVFEEEFPYITVEHDSIKSDVYAQMLQSKLDAVEVDLFVGEPQNELLGGFETVDSRFVDLSDQAFVGNYLTGILDTGKVDGHVYMIPAGIVGTSIVFYNKTVADELGLSVPTTWTEFLAFLDAYKAAGKEAIGIGLAEQWPIQMFQLGMEPVLARGENPNFWEDLKTGTTAFNGPAYLEIFEKTEILSGYFMKNAMGETYDNGLAAFTSGDAMVMIDGSWRAGDIQKAADFEVGVMALPVSEQAEKNNVLPVKQAHGYMINKNSPQENIDAALTFLEFLSRPDIYQSYIDITGYLTAQPDAKATGTVVTMVNDFYATSTLVTNSEYLYWTGGQFDFITPATEMLAGTKTPQEAADAMQAKFIASEAEWR